MKAKSRNSVSAYARGGGTKASPQCSRAESESGGVSLFSGGETRESGPLFCFPSSSFELQSIGDLAVADRWEKIGVRYGKGFALWFMGCGCNAHSTPRRKHSAQRHCEALRAVSLRFVCFYAFSRLRRESPRVLLRVMRICENCRRFPFLIACKWRECSMNCDFLIWCFPEKILTLPSEKPHPVCGSLFHFLVLRRPSYFPLIPRSESTVTARVRTDYAAKICPPLRSDRSREKLSG